MNGNDNKTLLLIMGGIFTVLMTLTGILTTTLIANIANNAEKVSINSQRIAAQDAKADVRWDAVIMRLERIERKLDNP